MTTIGILILIAAVIVALGYFLRDKFSGWKTRAASILGALSMALVSILQEVQNYKWTEVLPPEYAPKISFGVFIAFLVLREITKHTPEKENV